MTRPDPDRIFAARKAEATERLVRDHGVPRRDAEAWIEHYAACASDVSRDQSIERVSFASNAVRRAMQRHGASGP
jgi:hypothetical protein